MASPSCGPTRGAAVEGQEQATGTKAWQGRDRSPTVPGFSPGDLADRKEQTRLALPPGVRALPQEADGLLWPRTQGLDPSISMHPPPYPALLIREGNLSSRHASRTPAGTSRPAWPSHQAPTLFLAHHLGLEESGHPTLTSVVPSKSKPPVMCHPAPFLTTLSGPCYAAGAAFTLTQSAGQPQLHCPPCDLQPVLCPCPIPRPPPLQSPFLLDLPNCPLIPQFWNLPTPPQPTGPH